MRRLALCLALVGCYSPKIADGTFQCGGGGSDCPSGFSCGPDRRCYSASTIQSHDFSGRGNGELGKKGDNLVGPGTLIFDSQSGAITFAASNGAMTPVVTADEAASSGGFVTTLQSDGQPVANWRFTSLTIPAGVSLVPALADFHVVVISATSAVHVLGPISLHNGGRGGQRKTDGEVLAAASDSAGGGAGDDTSGGGGAGASSPGRAGAGTAGGHAGTAVTSTVAFERVFLGSGGGGGGGTNAFGGNGGGSIAVFAAAIEIGDIIDVSGLNGSTAAGGGGGGGGGGSILLSADTIQFDHGGVLRAVGGSAGTSTGGASDGGKGADGWIWLGYSTPVIGTMDTMPGPIPSSTPITGFPR